LKATRKKWRKTARNHHIKRLHTLHYNGCKLATDFLHIVVAYRTFANIRKLKKIKKHQQHVRADMWQLRRFPGEDHS